MRHSLYANNRDKTPDRVSRFNPFERSKGFSYPGSRPASTALDCYKDDQDGRIDILDEYSLYRINLTFAIWYNDRDLEKKLYSDFVRYLDQKITERRG